LRIDEQTIHSGYLIRIQRQHECVRPYWRDKEVSTTGENYHYNHNHKAETYLKVGNALGWAMAELLGVGN
jgi:hypothetical protein